MNIEIDALRLSALGGARDSANVSLWGVAVAVALVAAIALVPRREHLVIGTKDKPPESAASGGKPGHGGYASYNRFLVATRLWEFVKIGASNFRRQRR
jgi:hypothetical protein